jgi:GTP-binding protein HflX|tara:strand:+ start:8235 stop:9524 length:1290 start_codon:yes stop_codon:yes gene_type:complete
LLDDVKNSDIDKEKVLLVGIYGLSSEKYQAEEHLEELALLTDTAGGIPVAKVLQQRNRPDVSSYVGKGKLTELKGQMSALGAKTIIFDDDLSPTQIRNVEKVTDAKVLDRSALILDIFASRAQTAAAKTQVELAQLQYLLPRLTRYWTHLSRQSGGIGTKGPGETQIETDRRIIGQRIGVLKSKLEKLDKQRTTQRKSRDQMTRLSLVGYTNAGKSTLMNALTDSGVFTENRLFATLDSTVRRHQLRTHEILLSDTVGFIRKLPHHLVQSFKSTLDEVREADLLIHLVDGSSTMVHEYIEVVQQTLKELKSNNKQTLLVFNKVDRMDDEQHEMLRGEYPNALYISAIRGIGLSELEEAIEQEIESHYIKVDLEIPIQAYKAVAFIHEHAHVENEKYTGEFVHITCRIDEKDFKQLSKMLNTIEYSIGTR